MGPLLLQASLWRYGVHDGDFRFALLSLFSVWYSNGKTRIMRLMCRSTGVEMA
jgi:hypothetical protein